MKKANCLNCGDEFIVKAAQKYCSTLCRSRKYRSLNKSHLKESKKNWDTENIEHKRKYEREALQEKTHLREYRKDYTLKRYFNISLEQYNEILEKQGNKCPVCSRHKDEFSKYMPVDHDHTTGEIRGIVCSDCNVSVLRHFVDPEIYERAKQYLKENKTGFFVPEKYIRGKKKA